MPDNEEIPCIEHNGILMTIEDAITLITCEKAFESNGLITADMLNLTKRVYGKYNNRAYTDAEAREIIEKRNKSIQAEKQRKRRTQTSKKSVQKDANAISIDDIM